MSRPLSRPLSRVVSGNPWGDEPLDPDALIYSGTVSTMGSPYKQRLSDVIRMLKGESGPWEQLSADCWTGTAGLWLLMGDYQIMPATKSDNFTTIYDVKLAKNLAATGVSGANRGMRFTGTNYLQSTGPVLTSSPLAVMFIGNTNNVGAAQRCAVSQNAGAVVPGRSSFINFTIGGVFSSFYNDGVSEQATSDAVESSNDTRIFAMRNTGGGGAADLDVYTDGVAAAKGTSDTGRTYTPSNTDFVIGRTNDAGQLPFTGNGKLCWAYQGVISEADLGKIGRNFNRILRLGVRGGGFEAPFPNGNPRSQFALQEASQATTTAYLGSPSIIRAGSELLALHDTFGTNASLVGKSKLYVSADEGLTWSLRATISACFWGRMFRKPGDPDGTFYILGTGDEFTGHPVIKKTTDSGVNWTSTTIEANRCSVGNTNVLFKDGYMVAAMEAVTSGTRPNGVFVYKIALSSDFMVAGNWSKSAIVANTTYDPIFGIALASGQEAFEHNMVERPDGSLGLMGRLSFAGDFASWWDYDLTTNTLTAVETRALEAGWCKFHILRCPTTDQYLCFGNKKPGDVTDDRTKMQVWKSADLVTWDVVETIVDLGAFNYQEEGDSYPYAEFDGDDILLVSRLGFNGANSHHNTNRGVFRIVTDYVTRFGL